jgi:hypothetical protein
MLFGTYFVVCYFIGNKQEVEKEDNSVLSSDPPKVQTAQANLNPLTGMKIRPEKVNVRPIAVMINNIKAAQPLIGVSKADIIYETLVEGGITRLMAIYQDPTDTEKIGSIRSARPPFINIANGHDCVYIHIGGSSQADQMLKDKAIDHFNLMEYQGMFWRDEERRKNLAYEHSVVTSGQKLLDGIFRTKTRYEIKKDKVIFQVFGISSQISSNVPAQKIDVTFSNYKSTTFEYDETKKVYLVSQFDTKQMDSEYDSQVSVKNVIILWAKVFSLDEKGHKGIELTNGKGYFCSDGKKIDIKWEKSDENASFVYTHTDTGERLVMPPGNSYVSITSLESEVKVN